MYENTNQGLIYPLLKTFIVTAAEHFRSIQSFDITIYFLNFPSLHKLEYRN